MYPDDRPPELKKGGKCILFLKNTHESADLWFAVQRPSSRMALSLARVVAEAAKKEQK